MPGAGANLPAPEIKYREPDQASSWTKSKSGNKMKIALTKGILAGHSCKRDGLDLQVMKYEHLMTFECLDLVPSQRIGESFLSSL